jgi:hypothetical protein
MQIVGTIIALFLLTAATGCTRARADVAFRHTDYAFTYGQVLDGAPGIIKRDFKSAKSLAEDSRGLIRMLSDLSEIRLSEEWLSVSGVLQHWGEPDDREDRTLIYYPSGDYDPDEYPSEQDLAFIYEVQGEVHKVVAWRDGGSLESASAQRFVFGEIPLYGTYDEIRRVLGQPSAFVPDARWMPEMPSMVQWNFMVGEAPQRIVVAVNVAFSEARVRKCTMKLAYETEGR